MGRVQVGLPLFAWTLAIGAVAGSAAAFAAMLTENTIPRWIILGLALVGIVALWSAAIRNGRVERDVRQRLEAEHPGALVERVRIWRLPHGPLEAGTPAHFIVADAREVTFETIDQVVLLRIPVTEIGLVDLLTAKGDRGREKAVTIIYGEFQDAVQFFTVTYLSADRLLERVRTAIAQPDAP